MKKRFNGFTLIELLAVIIVLAVVTLIATPIVLNIVEDAKNEANMRTVDGLVDGGRQYCANAMFDTEAKKNITNVKNVYDSIIVSGSKPDAGEIYVNDKCQVAIKLVQNNKCYSKFFDTQVTVKDASLCNDYVGKDDVIPTVELELLSGTINDLGWSKEDLKIKVIVKDEESGPKNYKWCSDVTECTPTSVVNGDTGLVDIKAEGNNKVCVIGYDKSGKESEVKCSEVYKIDKTKPSIEGIADVTIKKDEVVDLTTGVTVNDSLSGIKDNYDYNPKVVDTTKAGITNVIYTVNDKAGNTTEITRKVIVDSEAPTITYTTLGDKLNGAGWAKENFIVQVDLVDNSGLGIKEGKWCSSNTTSTCTPNAVISGTTMNPQISLEGSNRICVEATDNNNKTSEVSCSDVYKLDKTTPTVGTATISGTLGSNSWYTSNITIVPVNGSDGLSGHNTTITDISSVTSNTSGTTITITTTDVAGNSSSRNYTVKVDKNTPSLTAKSDAITIIEGDSILTSTYFNTPTYSISGGSMSCNPINTSGLVAGNQTITCTAVGNNGLSISINKNIIVKPVTLYQIASSLVYENGQCKNDGSTYKYLNGCYLRGDQSLNYVWYNGFLYRIMGINNDSSIRLIAEDIVTAIAYNSANNSNFLNSYTDKWLNTYFYNNLGSIKNLMVDSDFCQNTTTNSASARTDCTGGITFKKKISLLSLDEFNLSMNNQKSYLISNNYPRFITPFDNGLTWYENSSSNVLTSTSFYMLGIKPIINIEKDSFISKGNGTISNYYILGENKNNTTGTLIEKVKIGEYVKFANKNYRVIENNASGTKLALDGVYPNKLPYGTVGSSIPNCTLCNDSNILEWLVPSSDISNRNKLQNTTWYHGDKLDYGTDYENALIKTNPYTSYWGLMNIGDILAGRSFSMGIHNGYWIANFYDGSYPKIIWGGSDSGHALATESYSVRPVIVLKSNSNIVTGDGTPNNPYLLTN